MATLGDKTYTYNYWGVPDPARVWGTVGVGGYATLVNKNIWAEYPDGIYYVTPIYGIPNPDNGKPFEDSVALWHLPKNASFACNAIFSVDRSSTLTAHYTVNVENNKVPLAMAAIDDSDGAYGKFVRELSGRYAYDKSDVLNGPYSALIYDIVYNNFCLRSSCTYYNTSTKARANIPIDNIHTVFTDENFKAIFIQNQLYRGAATPRINTNEYIPPKGLMTTAQGQPLIDTLSNIPIPDNETYLKSVIRDGHDDWRDDVIYRPFVTQVQQMLYNGQGTATISNQINIGFDRQLTVSQIKNGAYVISGDNRISAQYYRCNNDVKTFSDVVYRWVNVAFDETNLVQLDNGFNLDLLANSNTIRFMTMIDIVDKKGNSYGQAVENAIKHEVAYIGMYFTSSTSTAQNAELGTAVEGVYLPLFSGGVTTGEYVTGDDIPLQPHATAGSVADETFKYIPDENESGDFESITNTGTIGAGVSYYALDNTQVNALATWLNTTYEPTDQDEFIQDFKGVNPGDYITTMMFYPFDIPLDPGTDIPLVVGKLSTGTSGRPLDYTYGDLFDYGSYTFPTYGDFRDYLMKISVFVPFCGTLDLDPRLWAGRTINVKMSIDFPTGACTAYLFRLSEDGKWFKLDSISGTIGVPLPLSSVANGSYQVAITNLLAAHKSAYRSTVMGALGVVGGAASAIGMTISGNWAGAAASLGGIIGGATAFNGSVDKMDNIDYNIDHTAPTVSQVSGGSPFINCGSDYRVAIFVTTPLMLPGYNASVYGRTTGYATCKQGKLKDIASGFTRCASAELSGISCTSSERKMIFDTLQSGVII